MISSLWIFGWVWMTSMLSSSSLPTMASDLVYLMVDPKEWHHCQNKLLSIYMTVYCDTDCINTHTSNNALVFVVFIFHTSFLLKIFFVLQDNSLICHLHSCHGKIIIESSSSLDRSWHHTDCLSSSKNDKKKIIFNWISDLNLNWTSQISIHLNSWFSSQMELNDSLMNQTGLHFSKALCKPE